MAITHAPLVSAIIIPKLFFSFSSPRLFVFQNPYTRATSTSTGCDYSASNSLETVMVLIHIPLRLYKPVPGSFLFTRSLPSAISNRTNTTFLLSQWLLLPLLPPPFPSSLSPLEKPLQNMTPLLPTRPALLCIGVQRNGTSVLGQRTTNP
jgi:hypothetical protein